MADEYIPFTDFRAAQYSPTLTLEDSIKRCAALGGLHDFEFQDEIDEDGSSLSNFNTSAATGVWTITDDEIAGTGDAGDNFYVLQHNTEVEPSFVLTFKKDCLYGGITLLDNRYIVSWTGGGPPGTDEVKISTFDFNDEGTVLARRPIAIEDDVEIAIVVRFQALNQFDEIDWLSISVYHGGQCVVGASDWIFEDTFTNYIGLACYSTEPTAYFYDIRIAELKWVREWTSVDPSEAVGMGLNRAVGTTPVFYFCTYDGTLRAWVPGDRDVDWAIPDGRLTRRANRENYFVPGHIRMVGAYHEATVMDQTMMEQAARGLFDVPNDPNLMTQAEAEAGATRAHRVMREQRNQHTLEGAANPLSEPHDRVTYDGDDLRVVAVELQLVKEPGAGPKAGMQLQCQEYIAE